MQVVIKVKSFKQFIKYQYNKKEKILQHTVIKLLFQTCKKLNPVNNL